MYVKQNLKNILLQTNDCLNEDLTVILQIHNRELQSYIFELVESNRKSFLDYLLKTHFGIDENAGFITVTLQIPNNVLIDILNILTNLLSFEIYRVKKS